MNKVIRLVECDIKMEPILQSLMLDLDVDSKNVSVIGQELDKCIMFVAPRVRPQTLEPL